MICFSLRIAQCVKARMKDRYPGKIAQAFGRPEKYEPRRMGGYAMHARRCFVGSRG